MLKIAGMLINQFASVCKKVYGQKKSATLHASMAKWIRRPSLNAKVAGSSPPMGQIFFMLKMSKLMLNVSPGVCKKILWSKRACSTMYSQAVTHPSTNMAQCCLTSVIGQELVLST